MTTITISRIPRQIFIAHASRYAIAPIHIGCQGDLLQIAGMAEEDIAQTLANASFPAWELYELKALARKIFCVLPQSRRYQLAAIAQMLIFEDIPSQTIYRGINREEKLAAAFGSYIQSGSFNFDGFCKFNLPGYRSYLGSFLRKANEELTAKEEEQKYLQLLRNALSKGSSEVTLFFSPGDICQIWQNDEEGLHQLEGGHIHGVEWLLLANLICLDPQKIIVRDSIYADEQLLLMLDMVFEDKVVYDSSRGVLPRLEKIILDKCHLRC